MSAGVAEPVSPARGGLKSLLEAAVADGTVVQQNVSLAELTTLRVGGQADWFAEPQSQADLSALVSASREHGLPVTALGLGSNFLVLDSGVRGLTVRLSAGVFAGNRGGRQPAQVWCRGADEKSGRRGQALPVGGDGIS